MPRLTVIMPAYNAATTIAQAVRTTLFDLPRDADLHVLDDASGDNTLQVLEQLAHLDRRLVVRSAGRNRGVAATLNDLLEGTQSQFVARMDADDLVIPGRFRHALSVLQTGTADVVFAGLVHLGPGRKVRPAAQLPISSAAFASFLLLQNPVTHSTMVAVTSVLREAQGYREVPSEDYDLWLRLVAGGLRLRRLAQPGVFYRHHPAQITATGTWKAAAAYNPLSAEAHATLTEQVLGARHEVYSILRTADLNEAEQAAFSRFVHALKNSTDALGLVERADLIRLCAKVTGNRLQRRESYAK
ncbi:glycosyltransferase family 2 protein [Arthrobacter sp. MDT3-44]